MTKQKIKRLRHVHRLGDAASEAVRMKGTRVKLTDVVKEMQVEATSHRRTVAMHANPPAGEARESTKSSNPELVGKELPKTSLEESKMVLKALSTAFQEKLGQ